MIFLKYNTNHCRLLLRIVAHVSQSKSQSPFNDISLTTSLLAVPGTYQACSYLRTFALDALTVLAASALLSRRRSSLKLFLKVQLANKAHPDHSI